MTIACEKCGAAPSSLHCAACAEEIPVWAIYCPFCGDYLKKTDSDSCNEDSFNASSRRLCPDGNCIGVLKEDGKCCICGKSEDNRGCVDNTAIIEDGSANEQSGNQLKSE